LCEVHELKEHEPQPSCLDQASCSRHVITLLLYELPLLRCAPLHLHIFAPIKKTTHVSASLLTRTHVRTAHSLHTHAPAVTMAKSIPGFVHPETDFMFTSESVGEGHPGTLCTRPHLSTHAHFSRPSAHVARALAPPPAALTHAPVAQFSPLPTLCKAFLRLPMAIVSASHCAIC
jgi:hypothetical protein